MVEEEPGEVVVADQGEEEEAMEQEEDPSEAEAAVQVNDDDLFN